jgi:purine-cytosine permease-like protein
METLTNALPPRAGGAWRGLAWLGAALSTVAAAAVGAVLAVFLTATIVVIVLMASLLLGFAGLAFRARRGARIADPKVIEARNVGGHSWVAYGWRDGVG